MDIGKSDLGDLSALVSIHVLSIFECFHKADLGDFEDAITYLNEFSAV